MPIINDTLAKIRDIEALGVDYLFNVEFTVQMSNMQPEEFMQMLENHLAPKFVVTGPNYTFGAKGAGTPQLYKKKAKNMDLKRICIISYTVKIAWLAVQLFAKPF